MLTDIISCMHTQSTRKSAQIIAKESSWTFYKL